MIDRVSLRPFLTAHLVIFALSNGLSIMHSLPYEEMNMEENNTPEREPGLCGQKVMQLDTNCRKK
jgi:hypothetical protein